jgi:hypothetical protein
MNAKPAQAARATCAGPTSRDQPQALTSGLTD